MIVIYSVFLYLTLTANPSQISDRLKLHNHYSDQISYLKMMIKFLHLDWILSEFQVTMVTEVSRRMHRYAAYHEFVFFKMQVLNLWHEIFWKYVPYSDKISQYILVREEALFGTVSCKCTELIQKQDIHIM